MFLSKDLNVVTSGFSAFEVARKIGIVKRKAEEMGLDFRYDRYPHSEQGTMKISATGDADKVSEFTTFVKKYFVIQ